MTLSKNDIALNFSEYTEKKIFKSIFSNILFSSAILLLVLLFVFRVNKSHMVSTFVYGYLITLGFNLISANYIKKEYCNKEKSGLNEDFRQLMFNATENPIILKPKIGSGIVSDHFDENNNYNDLNELEELDSFLDNN